MITRRGLLSAIASLPIVASIQRVFGAEPIPHEAFGDKVKAISAGLDDPATQIIWVTGPRRSGKSFMARYLRAALGGGGPTLLHVPTWDDRKSLIFDHGLGPDQVSSGCRDLRRGCFKYVIIDHWEAHPPAVVSYYHPDEHRSVEYEGDIVDLAYQRTLSFRDSKVIVFSEMEPPGWVYVHHVRFAPIA